jgi:hypothetical protein
MSNREARKINQFFANFIAKLRKWLVKVGSPFRISRKFVRSLFNQSRRSPKGSAQAGFVLPTVVLVATVVTLLTVTLVTRSADRARTAVSARVEQASRVAATPLVDRARIKIEQLINDDTLAKGIPGDIDLLNVISDKNNSNNLYTFRDETRLQLFDTSSSSIPGATAATQLLESGPAIGRRTSRTAWRVGLDTDGNGKLDTFGLYSITFRKQNKDNNSTVLAAKSPPMAEGSLGANCVAADLAGAVSGGSSDWYAQPGKFTKSFFVHSLTVPITPAALAAGITDLTIPNDNTYEAFPGAPSFAALELQQDRSFKAQNPNAVWFDGDVEIYSRSSLRINGRVVAGGNLLVSPADDTSVAKVFYQVSDPFSCFYEEENSKIIVAGNVVDGDSYATGNASTITDAITVDLFRGKEVPPNATLPLAPPYTFPLATFPGLNINATNRTVEESGQNMVSNESAFERRFNVLLKAALEIDAADPGTTNETKTTRPQQVFDAIAGNESLVKAYGDYIKQRLRKVTFKEVPFNTSGGEPIDVYRNLPAFTGTVATGCPSTPAPTGDLSELECKTKLPGSSGYVVADNFNGTLRSALLSTANTGGSRNELKLPEYWSIPLVPAGTFAPYNNNALTPGGFIPEAATRAVALRALGPGNTAQLSATSFEERKAKGVEQFLGDRILVGNNLPSRWLKASDIAGTFEYAGNRNKNFLGGNGLINSVLWDDPNTEPRYRLSQSTPFPDLGIIKRDGTWEYQASQDPSLPPYPKNVATPTLTPTQTQTFTPNTGGLRVVTGSGIYTRESNLTFLPTPTIETGRTSGDVRYNNGNRSLVVWSDAMPMLGAVAWNTTDNAYRAFDETVRTWTSTTGASLTSPGVPKKGDLQMRATAVYHYKNGAYTALPDAPTPLATYQKPIACVSSYYDPTNAQTARNRPGLPDVSGVFDSDGDGNYDQTADGRTISNISMSSPGTVAASTQGLSNNGVSYTVSSTSEDITKGDLDTAQTDLNNTAPVVPPVIGTPADLARRLFHQSEMIFPNGRYANEPLRQAVRAIQASENLTLAEQSALDAEICALQILDGTITVSNAIVPHGAFKESSFLDARQVKSLNNNELGMTTTDNASNVVTAYDLEIEQRQPLEVRVTDINVNLIRTTPITGSINDAAGLSEYLLPYSGIVYATRDDALPDNSKVDQTAVPISTNPDSLTLSATDFKLDPTRRPNGIRLTDGSRLWRANALTVTAQPDYSDNSRGEKGITLVSNDPVYVKGNFNLHRNGGTAVEEFNTLVNADYSNIYQRANGTATRNLNFNFACRPDQRKDPNGNLCDGDEWRKADIIADAATVQSSGSKDGFRDQGDFDLRNNEFTGRVATGGSGLSILNGPAKFAATNFNPKSFEYLKRGFLNNSYVTNYNYATTGGDAPYPGSNRNTYNANGVTPIQRRALFGEYGMEICRKLPISECGETDWVKAGAGTTVLPNTGTVLGEPRYIAPEDLRFPRRISFLRLNDMPAGYAPVEIPVEKFSSGRTTPYVTGDLVDQTPKDDRPYVRAFLDAAGQPPLDGDTTIPGLRIPNSFPSGRPNGYLAGSIVEVQDLAIVRAFLQSLAVPLDLSPLNVVPTLPAGLTQIGPNIFDAPLGSGRTTPYNSGDNVTLIDRVLVTKYLAILNQDALPGTGIVPPLKIKTLTPPPTPSGRTKNYGIGSIVEGSDRNLLPAGLLSDGSRRGGKLILSGMLRCANTTGMPVPIGVVNGNDATGVTYGYTPVDTPSCVNFASASSASTVNSLAGSTSTSNVTSASTSNSVIIGTSTSASTSGSISTVVSASNSSASPSASRSNASATVSASGVSATASASAPSRSASLSGVSASTSVSAPSRSASLSRVSASTSASRVSATISASRVSATISASRVSATASVSLVSASTSVSAPSRSASVSLVSASNSVSGVSATASASLVSASTSVSAPSASASLSGVSATNSRSRGSASTSTSLSNASTSTSTSVSNSTATSVSNSIISSLRGGRTGLIQPTIAMRGGALPLGVIMPSIRKGTNSGLTAVMPTAVAFPFPNGTFPIEGDFDQATNGAGRSTSYVNPVGIFDRQAPGVKTGTTADNALWFRTTADPQENLAAAFGFTGANNDINYGFGTGNGNPIFMLVDSAKLGDSDYQPVVLPVIQLNFPNAVPENSSTVTNRQLDNYINSDNGSSGKWTERANDLTVNAIFVAGGTPSRTFSRYDIAGLSSPNLTNEGGGDLPNFIRLTENWAGRTLRIVGGFFQNRKSQFATAPFTPTYPFRNVVDAQFFPGQWNETEITSIFRDYIGTTDRSVAGGNKQGYISQTGFGIPYYNPPARVFGYDVGILSVPPNLFDTLFVEPSPTANEYFREVDREDPYIANLLCAVQNPGSRFGGTTSALINTPNSYLNYTLADPKMRPANCQVPPNYI